jgi:hypothetical protein
MQEQGTHAVPSRAVNACEYCLYPRLIEVLTIKIALTFFSSLIMIILGLSSRKRKEGFRKIKD